MGTVAVPAYFGGRRITAQAHRHHGETKLRSEFEFQSDWLGFKRKTRFKVTGVMHEYMHYPGGGLRRPGRGLSIKTPNTQGFKTFTEARKTAFLNTR